MHLKTSGEYSSFVEFSSAKRMLFSFSLIKISSLLFKETAHFMECETWFLGETTGGVESTTRGCHEVTGHNTVHVSKPGDF